MSNLIQVKRGSSSNRTSFTPAKGELVFDTDTLMLYIGDGSTAGGIKVSNQLIDTGNDLKSIQIMDRRLSKSVTINGGQAAFSIGDLTIENNATITLNDDAIYKVL
jgi:hypothetical protein